MRSISMVPENGNTLRIDTFSQPILRHTLTFQEINLNTETHSVSVQDRPVKLTRTEYAILKLLMENPSQVITKSVLLDRISKDTPDCMESSLKVKEIMDEAIAHSQKANVKHLARRVFGKSTDDSDRVILKEEDFKI